MRNKAFLIVTFFCPFILVGQGKYLSASDEALLNIRKINMAIPEKKDSLRCELFNDCNVLTTKPLSVREKSIACVPNKRVFGWHIWGNNSVANNYDWDVLTDISFFAYDVNPVNGDAINKTQVEGLSVDPVFKIARKNNININLCIKLFSNENAFDKFFSNPNAQNNLINNVVSIVVSNKIKGLNVDFEGAGLDDSYFNEFTNFIKKLSQQLHSAALDSELSIDLQGSYAGSGSLVRTLNPYIDLFVLMAYDYDVGLENGKKRVPVSPLYDFYGAAPYTVSGTTNQLLQYIPASKFLLGIPYYGAAWEINNPCDLPAQGINNNRSAATYATIKDNDNHYFDLIKNDPQSFNAYSCYQKDGEDKIIYFDNIFSYKKKYAFVNQRDLGGVAIWRLGQDAPYNDLWELLRDNFSTCIIYPCEETLFDLGGPFGNYHPNEHYIYTIHSPDQSSITLSFKSFNLTTNHATLKIYDGENANAKLIGTYTGSAIPKPITSTGGAVTIQFDSDGGKTNSGFTLYYNCSKPQTCTDSAEPNDTEPTASALITQSLSNTPISSTQTGRISTANDNDYWKIPIEANGEIKLTLFNLPYEYQVKILDPKGSKIDAAISNTPGTSEKVITYRYDIPQSRTLYAVVFPTGKGYSKCQDYSLRLEWKPDAPCKKIKLNSTITPASSAGATDGVIRLTHTAGTAPYTYTWDNGETTQDLANLAPDKYSLTVTADDGCKLDTAFTVGIVGQTQEPYCSGTTTLTSIRGTFSDGSGGQNFRPNSNCKWKIAVPNAVAIELSFTFFDPGRGDVIKVYDGPTTASPLLKTFDVGSDLDRITSSSGTLLVQFISDGADEAGGWTLTYEAIFNGNDGSVKINSFEYWFDDAFEQRREVFVVPQAEGILNTEIETNELELGVHVIHFRFIDTKGDPSVVTSNLFVKTEAEAPDTRYITDYEYWFDDDFEGRNGRDVNANATFDLNENFDVSDLEDGVHTVHHRFRDDLGQWSVITSDLFVKIPPQGEQLIRKYEYWIDEDFEQRFSQDVTPGILDFQFSRNLELSQLEDGVHSIHFRFQTAPGVWSATCSDLFVKLPASQFGERKIAGYEYWFDGQFEKRKVQSVNPKVLHYAHMALIDTDTLADGMHTFHIRYADDAAQWSVITNDTFAKRASAVVASFMASTSVICNRGEVSFINNSLRADNYIWDFGDGTTSTAHSPTHFYNNPGTYAVKLKAKNSTSEAISTALLIHVDALDLKISGGNSICWGDSIQLTASGAKNYTWSPNQDLKLISESRASVYPKMNTNYTLAGSSEHGCKADTTILIQVNPLPQVVIKNPTNIICAGGEKTIELSGASTFQISPSSTAIQLSVNTFRLNPTETSTYTISGQNQCGTKSERFILSVFPSKSIVLNEKICAGESYTVGGQLFNRKGTYRIVLKTTNGCDSIVTLNLSVFTQGVQSIRSQICKGDSVRVGGKSFSKPGNYQIDLTSVNGCDSTIFLNLSEYPSQAIPLILSTGRNEIGCNLIGKSYIWFFNDTQLAITSGQKLTITQSGEYKVQVISNNGCKSELSKSYTFVIVGSTQLSELLTVNIYPNPTDGILYLAFAKPTTAELFIYAADSKIVKKQSIIRRQNYEIDLSSISPGIYLIRLETKNGVMVKRFVKE